MQGKFQTPLSFLSNCNFTARNLPPPNPPLKKGEELHLSSILESTHCSSLDTHYLVLDTTLKYRPNLCPADVNHTCFTGFAAFIA
ncbi:hypothetical protein BH09BAC1_BH09BAC1_25370 [soil metagenome]